MRSRLLRRRARGAVSTLHSLMDRHGGDGAHAVLARRALHPQRQGRRRVTPGNRGVVTRHLGTRRSSRCAPSDDWNTPSFPACDPERWKRDDLAVGSSLSGSVQPRLTRRHGHRRVTTRYEKLAKGAAPKAPFCLHVVTTSIGLATGETKKTSSRKAGERRRRGSHLAKAVQGNWNSILLCAAHPLMSSNSTTVLPAKGAFARPVVFRTTSGVREPSDSTYATLSS